VGEFPQTQADQSLWRESQERSLPMTRLLLNAVTLRDSAQPAGESPHKRGENVRLRFGTTVAVPSANAVQR
jgi:hypothetical protein